MSTTRSLRTRRPRMGSMVTFGATSLTNTLQARAFRPLITIASEPHTPCAQDRRRARLPSRYHLTWWRASSRRSEGSMLTVASCHQGSRSISGRYRLIRMLSGICPGAGGPTLGRAPGSRGGPSSHICSSSQSGGSGRGVGHTSCELKFSSLATRLRRSADEPWSPQLPRRAHCCYLPGPSILPLHGNVRPQNHVLVLHRHRPIPFAIGERVHQPAVILP